MKIIHRYLLREIMGLFALSLFIITVLFMSQRIIQLTEWAVNRGVGPADIGRLMFYLLPNVLLIVVPIVTLFSILLGVGRLSSDQEIIALKASGLSLYSLFPPVIIFAFMAAGLAAFSSMIMIPKAAQASRILRYRVVQTRTDAAVRERAFLDLLDNTTFYIREKKRDGELAGVMAAIEDWPEDSHSWKSRQIAFARGGRFVHDAAALSNELWLFDGVMIREDRVTGRDDFATFETCRIKLDLGSLQPKSDEIRQEMDVFEMNKAIAEKKPFASKYEGKDRKLFLALIAQWHERLAFPFGCIALCFWAVPLGIQPPRAGRARPIVLSVLLAAVFYYLMILAKFGALKEWAPAYICMWTPGVIIFLSGIYMLRQKNLERPILVISRLEDTIYYLSDRMKAYLEERRKK